MSKFEKLAGEERHKQSKALWLPNIHFTSTIGKIKFNSSMKGATFDAPGMLGPYSNAIFETSIKHGNIHRNALSLLQPIYDLERLIASRELEKSADISNIFADLASQNLILLVAESYFMVLLANETVSLMENQKKAIMLTYKEIKKRFQLGDSSKTDLQEAAASLDNIKVKLISAKNDVKIKRLALQDLLGTSEDLKKLKETLLPDSFKFSNPLEEYVTKMRAKNLQLRIIMATQEIAKQEVAKYSAMSSIKLNAIAQVSKDRLKGINNTSNITKDYILGIQLSAPIFTGGYRSAKEEENLLLLEKSKIEYDKAALQIENSIRSIWFTLSSTEKRIKYLQNNLQTSKARLLLTIKGHAVGSRSTLEVLGAQSDALEVELSLFIEKIQFLLNRLKIIYMIGELTEEELISINHYLQ
jgi:outer membrane protein